MRKASEMKKEALALASELKSKKAKGDSVGKAVKKLVQAEFDSLPKSLQKELKEFR